MSTTLQYRKSRFHDEKGNAVDLGGLLYAPAAFVSAMLKRLGGFRPLRPMISYRAQADMAAWLTPQSLAVEFGSGRSTPWLARRCKKVISFEDNADWAQIVSGLLRRHGLDNVDYRVGPPARFTDLDDVADHSVTFALIDGSDRRFCLPAILPKMAVGGVVYLDNSDKDMTDPAGDLRIADTLLCETADRLGWKRRYYTDFSPTNFFCEQGLWVTVTTPYRPG